MRLVILLVHSGTRLLSADSLIGCQYLGPHEVKSPPGFKEAYEKYCQGDWVGLSFPTQFGGQDLPHSLSLFHSEILGAACQPWSSYPVSLSIYSCWSFGSKGII
jgi:alkylation response protein AidB-like acyl-CoA dehydrogenase